MSIGATHSAAQPTFFLATPEPPKNVPLALGKGFQLRLIPHRHTQRFSFG
jgi:hypothetical protein